MLGLGDSDESSAAVAFAFHEAASRDAVLDVVWAWRRPHTASHSPGPEARDAGEAIDDALRSLVQDHSEVTLERHSVEGPAREALLERAVGAELLVVGARHRHAKFGLQLGPVSHGVRHHSLCPVAVVPQPA